MYVWNIWMFLNFTDTCISDFISLIEKYFFQKAQSFKNNYFLSKNKNWKYLSHLTKKLARPETFIGFLINAANKYKTTITILKFWL